MPFVRLTTSAVIDERTDLMRSMSATTARLLAKPEAYVMVAVDEAAMLMSGSEDPAAFIDVRALGTMSPEITAALSRAARPWRFLLVASDMVGQICGPAGCELATRRPNATAGSALRRPVESNCESTLTRQVSDRGPGPASCVTATRPWWIADVWAMLRTDTREAHAGAGFPPARAALPPLLERGVVGRVVGCPYGAGAREWRE